MEHHGILVYDKNLAECRSALEVTEEYVLAKMGGIALQEVTDKHVLSEQGNTFFLIH